MSLSSRLRSLEPATVLCGALMFAFLVFLAVTGGEVLTEKDDGYRAASTIEGWTHRLAHQRTVGYPLFLRAVRSISPELVLLPFLQAAIFLAALGVFFVCLRRFGLDGWTAFFGTVPIAANNLLLPMAQRVLTDTVAVAVAIVAIGTLLLALAAPARKRWTLFAIVLFLAYQVRPVYVVLVPLAPLFTLVLLRFGPRARPWRATLAPAGLTALLAAVPLLLFCLLRFVVVGHFGLVSFGGFNLIGIAASMLSKDTVAALPADLQPLGTAILASRTERGMKPIQEHRSRYPRARQIRWYREFNVNVWRVSGRAAYREAFKRYNAEHPRPDEADVAAFGRWKAERRSWANVEADRRLMSLSLALLTQQRELYARWIAGGLRDGLRWTLQRTRGVLECALALLGALVWFWLRAALRGRQGLRSARRAFAGAWRAALPLFWIGAGTWSANLLLVALVERPVDRYIQAAAVLLPGALLALAWQLVVRSSGSRPFAAATDGEAPA